MELVATQKRIVDLLREGVELRNIRLNSLAEVGAVGDCLDRRQNERMHD